MNQDNQETGAAVTATQLRRRLASTLGQTRLAVIDGVMEGHVSLSDEATLYVLDIETGLLFAEPMVATSGQPVVTWELPSEQRLNQRRVRLMCSTDDPLSFEDAHALIGDEAEGMSVGISAHAEWFDLRNPGAAMSLLDIAQGIAVLKHPKLPLFVVGEATAAHSHGIPNMQAMRR